MIEGRWIARVQADPVRISIGLALVCGVAAMIETSLAGLTLALIALGVASHLLRYPRSDPALRRPPAIMGGVYAIFAAGVVGYVALPAPWEGTRAVVLAASAVPLALSHRRAGLAAPEASP